MISSVQQVSLLTFFLIVVPIVFIMGTTKPKLQAIRLRHQHNKRVRAKL